MPPQSSFGDRDPALSPDGKSVAFVRKFTWASDDLFIMPLAGGEPRRITRQGAWLRGIAWTADGASLVFSSDYRSSGITRLWRASVDKGMDQPSQLIDGAVRGAVFPAIARTNTGSSRLVFESQMNDSNIWMLDLADAGT